MQIGAQIRRQSLGFWVVGLAYEAAIALLINMIAGGDGVSFWVWLLGIQVAAFLLWVKNSGRAWLVFLVGRKGIENRVVSALRGANYPASQRYVDSASDYFSRIADNDDLSPAMRVQAARDEAILKAFASLGHYQDALRMNLVMDEALRRYAEEKAPQ